MQLSIALGTGRGVPKIIRAYSQDNIRFNENSITVTIPYDRLGGNAPVNVPVTVPVHDKTLTDIEERILAFCIEPKGILEIASFLKYEDKRTVRKYLNPLLESGKLARTIPEKPNSSKQKYITIK